MRALEKIAAESSEVIIENYVDTLTPMPIQRIHARARGYGDIIQHYIESPPSGIPEKRKEKLISKSGRMLGDFDFFFEWAKVPTWTEVEELVSKVDKALARLGCKYTISTK